MPGAAVPTLVVSDLHLGANSRVDLLRDPGPVQDALLGALDGVERLVIAGDLLELRHAPPRTVLDRARPFLGRLGAALGPDRELVVLAGNHDHRIVRPALHALRMAGDPLPLDLRTAPGATSPLAVAIAEALGDRGPRTTWSYPAAWLVPPPVEGQGGVLVTHGHYIDALWRMPTVERLSAGAAARSHDVRLDELAAPDDFERLLAPGYGWLDALADHAVGAKVGGAQRTSAGVWQHLNDRRSWTGRGLRVAVPRIVRLLRRAGIDGLDDRLTPETLRIAGLRGLDRVARQLGVRPDHLIAGHTHRAGPLPGDAAWEWRLEQGGGRMWNTGSWVRSADAPDTTADGPGTPYWPGRAVRVDADGEPRLLELVAALPGG